MEILNLNGYKEYPQNQEKFKKYLLLDCSLIFRREDLQNINLLSIKAVERSKIIPR